LQRTAWGLLCSPQFPRFARRPLNSTVGLIDKGRAIMAWTCPSCGFEENEDSILRCPCGYELTLPEDRNYDNVGGALLLVAIGLAVTAVANGLSLTVRLHKASYITGPTAATEAFFALVYIVTPLILLVILFMRKRIVPKLMISFYLLTLGIAVLLYIGARSLPGPHILQRALYEAKVSILASSVACFIWVPYFLISERVKRTFIR